MCVSVIRTPERTFLADKSSVYVLPYALLARCSTVDTGSELDCSALISCKKARFLDPSCSLKPFHSTSQALERCLDYRRIAVPLPSSKAGLHSTGSIRRPSMQGVKSPKAD